MRFDVFKHQNKFIRTTEKFPLLCGGYGSGKTVSLCLKASINWCFVSVSIMVISFLLLIVAYPVYEAK